MKISADEVTVERIAGFLALMQGGSGLKGKAPSYIAEKFQAALHGGVGLDSGNQAVLDEWKGVWVAHLT
jgi:hypothetical protein